MNGRPASPRRSFLASALRALTLVAGLGCAVFFAREVGKQWHVVRDLAWSGTTIAGLVAAVLTLVFTGLVDAWTWGWLLRTLGVEARSRVAIGVFCQAQFAKYIPGNVGQHIGRLELARRAGWQLGRIALSIIIENGLAVGSGALFAALGLLMLGTHEVDGRLPLVAGALLVGLIVAVTLGRALLARPPALLSRALKLEHGIDLSWPFVMGVFVSHLLSHLSNALALTWLLLGSGAPRSDWIWRVPAVATIGWLSGYLLPGAPAGLGVRELVVTRLLAPSIGEAAALSASLLWRIAALFTDLLLFSAGSALRRSASPSPPSSLDGAHT